MIRPIPLVLSTLLWPAVLSFGATPAVTTLPEVIVTAGETVPSNAAVTEVPATTPALTHTPELQSLTNRAPNFSVSDASQHSLGGIYSVRGVTNTVFFSSQAVGLYQDDVPFGDAFTFAAPLYDIDRVEILRGPQGDRFGLNSEAGLLSLHTHEADRQTWHGEGSASFASYDTEEYRLSLGGPLIKDRLTLELAGYQGLSSGYVTNDYLGIHRDNRDTLSGRAVLTWTPAPDWKITLGEEATRINDGSQRLVSLEGDPYRVTSDQQGGLDIHSRREWLDVTKTFDTWQVRSITGHMGYEANPAVLDLDLTPARAGLSGILPGVLPVAPGALSVIRRTQDEWSSELRFESLPPKASVVEDKAVHDQDGKKAIMPLAPEDRFHWAAGLFYQRKDTSEDDVRSFSAPFVTAIPFGPVLAPITVYTPLAQTTQFHIVEEQLAAYANAGYKLGRLELDAGIRLDYDRKTFYRQKDDGFGGLARLNGQHDDWTVGGSLGGLYHVTDGVGVFARSAYGFKPGGFSGYTDDPKLAEFSREINWSNEVGVRAKGLGGKLNAQLLGYYNYLQNYQVERTFSFTDYLVVNADRAESLGLELDLSWEILHGLTFSGNIGYNQTQLIGYRDPLTGSDLSGNEAPFVPEFTALAALDYAHECGFRAHVELVGVGETQFTDTNTAHFRQAPYALVNARVGYERKNWGAYLFGRNLSDTRYFTQKSSDLDAGIVGEPSIFGVMGLVRF